ncbi:MAG: flagellar biosynthesis protein FlhB [Oceanococcus sp.]
MSETAAEKTQEPTPKRLRESRKKGEVPRSRELGTLAITAGSVLVIAVFGTWFGEKALLFLRHGLSLERAQVMNPAATTLAFSEALVLGLQWLIPFLAAGIVFAFAAPVLLGGWNFSTEALQPQFKRMNPLSGLKRIFSSQALMELVKALAKFFLLGGMAVVVLWTWRDKVFALATKELSVGIIEGLGLCFSTVAALCIGLAAIAAIDAPFQYFSHRKKQRMSLQEVKDEMKESEGRPEVKQQMRQMQQEAGRKRMAQDMQTANVVINNPSHFSVALYYDPDGSAAPKVVAKGANHMAEVIRDLAKENRVPQLRIAPLARALYRHVDVGAEIPAGLYLAVAEVLSYIFTLNTKPQQAGETPNPDVPEDYQWQSEKS